MEGASNGGMLYHEVQESKLCAVHCVNTVLQGPFFSEFDLAALASDLDRKERQMMLGGSTTGDFLSEESHNVSLDGDFSIQVLQKALEVWDLQVIPLNSPVAEPAQIDPELENAFICHLQDHWFCIRKVNGEWYNFDSLYAAPQHLSKFYLSAYLDSLKGFGWSIFLVRGNFPKDFPISSSEASNGYGQWLSPEDAERITKSCNSTQAPPQRINWTEQQDTFLSSGEAEMLMDMEDEELKAAIAASLMDSSAGAANSQNEPAASTQQAASPQNIPVVSLEPANSQDVPAVSPKAAIPQDVPADPTKSASPKNDIPVVSPEAATSQDVNAVSPDVATTQDVGAVSPDVATTQDVGAVSPDVATTQDVGAVSTKAAISSNEPAVSTQVAAHQNESGVSQDAAFLESVAADAAECAVSSPRKKISRTTN
ncbi:ataxin-3 homolog [Momordica charantia]|uniref:ubiquitinyl hydrolase 1 n=1 Tax=Momordica charantia TaxID=3673 RepID=A0A6J1CV65_MOMCH|nr:ataxin-3 homolog [Momordica charantia]